MSSMKAIARKWTGWLSVLIIIAFFVFLWKVKRTRHQCLHVGYYEPYALLAINYSSMHTGSVDITVTDLHSGIERTLSGLVHPEFIPMFPPRFLRIGNYVVVGRVGAVYELGQKEGESNEKGIPGFFCINHKKESILIAFRDDTTGKLSSQVGLFRISDREPFKVVDLPMPVVPVAVSPDNRYLLATIREEGIVFGPTAEPLGLFDLERGEMLWQTEPRPFGEVRGVNWQEEFYVRPGNDEAQETLEIISLEDGRKRLATLPYDDRSVVSPDARFLTRLDLEAKRIRVFSLPDQKLLVEVKCPTEMGSNCYATLTDEGKEVVLVVCQGIGDQTLWSTMESGGLHVFLCRGAARWEILRWSTSTGKFLGQVEFQRRIFSLE